MDNPANPETAPVETQESGSVETVVTDKSAKDQQEQAQPQDWRDEVSGGDEKLRKMLDRVQSLKDLGRNYLHAQDKIRKGDAKTLPENPSDEELAAWREEHGIPATWEEYDTSLDEGLIIGDADKPILDNVLKAMHESNARPEQVKSMLGAYYKAQSEHVAAIQDRDNQERESTISALREEWGSDFNANKNAITGFINTMPESIRDEFMSSRLASGSALFNNPDALMFFADMARKLNPAATVVPNSANPTQAISDEMASLEKMMGNRNSEYWKGPKAEQYQKRYRELLQAKSNMQT